MQAVNDHRCLIVWISFSQSPLEGVLANAHSLVRVERVIDGDTIKTKPADLRLVNDGYRDLWQCQRATIWPPLIFMVYEETYQFSPAQRLGAATPNKIFMNCWQELFKDSESART